MEPAGTPGSHPAPRVRRAHRRRPHDDGVHRGLRRRHRGRRDRRAIRQFEGTREAVATIYLHRGRATSSSGRGAARADRHFAGVAPLSALSEPLVTCAPDTPQNEVAALFDKYNLITLAVVDEHGRLAGIITADDVITMLRHTGLTVAAMDLRKGWKIRIAAVPRRGRARASSPPTSTTTRAASRPIRWRARSSATRSSGR